MRTRQQPYADLERIIEFDFVRATEAAALNTLPWIGRGEKKRKQTLRHAIQYAGCLIW